MIPGKYVATHFLNGRTVQYLPLRIDENSPEELTFQLPKATVYRGRTVDGVTGKPMGRVWAAATKGRGRANLAELTDADWNQLRAVTDIASHTGQRGWGIAYNTNAKGVAHFFLQPNSEGKICVEISRPPASSKMERLETTFQIRDQARGSPFEFRLTAEQVQLIPHAGTDKKKK